MNVTAVVALKKSTGAPYAELELLSKTDRKWMRGAWGEPQTHTTANHKYRDVWDRYENVLIDENRSKGRGATIDSLFDV